MAAYKGAGKGGMPGGVGWMPWGLGMPTDINAWRVFDIYIKISASWSSDFFFPPSCLKVWLQIFIGTSSN